MVNVRKGAAVMPASQLMPPECLASIREQGLLACEALDSAWGERRGLELGIDFVLDSKWRPTLIEINGRPKGRLEALRMLDSRWSEEHIEACTLPLRTLAAWRQL